MFGCGLPVFTAAYPCISELVRHGVNGLHFDSAAQLAEQLESVFLGFPSQSGRLKEMQASSHAFPRCFDWGTQGEAALTSRAGIQVVYEVGNLMSEMDSAQLPWIGSI